ncbi:hypothetical protein LZ32DRAFT_431314 [Colletotrichum eremochloae]|nr:hypothetical protein LZ32DRAFT_431314 [Colletotrichum eremochloae]
MHLLALLMQDSLSIPCRQTCNLDGGESQLINSWTEPSLIANPELQRCLQLRRKRHYYRHVQLPLARDRLAAPSTFPATASAAKLDEANSPDIEASRKTRTLPFGPKAGSSARPTWWRLHNGLGRKIDSARPVVSEAQRAWPQAAHRSRWTHLPSPVSVDSRSLAHLRDGSAGRCT